MRSQAEFLRDLKEAHRADERLHAASFRVLRRYTHELEALRARIAELEETNTRAETREPGLFDALS
jgi:hypothetical protein